LLKQQSASTSIYKNHSSMREPSSNNNDNNNEKDCCDCQCCAERVRALEAQVERLQGQLQQTRERSKTNERHVHRVQEQSQLMLQHFACMSHEIRTPLNCVVGMASLLHDTPLNQFQQEAVRMIASSGELLSTVVDDVLDYSKLQTGDFALNVQTADLQMTLDCVIAAVQMKADQAGSGLWIRTFIGSTVPQYLDTDAKRLQQILYNVLGNSVKFSQNNSYIDLKCDIIHNDNDGNKIIRFAVKDYGKAFHQENKDTGTIYGGTGLGLPITAKLTEKLGGQISVQSEVSSENGPNLQWNSRFRAKKSPTRTRQSLP